MNDSDQSERYDYNELNSEYTEDLLDFWLTADDGEWAPEEFELIRLILKARLGFVPPQPPRKSVEPILLDAERHLDSGKLIQALESCEQVIYMQPDLADAYNLRGEIYEEMGRKRDAFGEYQRALQLDHSLDYARQNLSSIEKVYEEEFLKSEAKERLDRALEYAYDDAPDLALQVCETAKQTLPDIALAYNYLGLILETLEQLEPAIDAYFSAVQRNPRFYPARENLANARVRWEEEHYLDSAAAIPEETLGSDIQLEEADFADVLDGNAPVPGWVYLGANAYTLRGWPGNRNRPGRTGYDPLETPFELAHIRGTVFGLLAAGKFRTRNPLNLLMMTLTGLIYCSPLLIVFAGNPIKMGWLLTPVIIPYSPYWLVGAALLLNVILSISSKPPDENAANGTSFF